jgi:hypothetical protein
LKSKTLRQRHRGAGLTSAIRATTPQNNNSVSNITLETLNEFEIICRVVITDAPSPSPLERAYGLFSEFESTGGTRPLWNGNTFETRGNLRLEEMAEFEKLLRGMLQYELKEKISASELTRTLGHHNDLVYLVRLVAFHESPINRLQCSNLCVGYLSTISSIYMQAGY